MVVVLRKRPHIRGLKSNHAVERVHTKSISVSTVDKCEGDRWDT